jgi:hypothetical protein
MCGLERFSELGDLSLAAMLEIGIHADKGRAGSLQGGMKGCMVWFHTGMWRNSIGTHPVSVTAHNLAY